MDSLLFDTSSFHMDFLEGAIKLRQDQNRFDEESFLNENFHKKQQELLRLEADTIVLMTGRRPGKSFALSGHIVLIDQLTAPGVLGFYPFGATSIQEARELVLDKLEHYDDKYRLGWHWGDFKKYSTIYTPNKTIIRLIGINDEVSWKKMKGKPIKGAAVDECDDIKASLLKKYDEDAINMGRLDFSHRGYKRGGQFIMSGNPPRKHTGHFYEQRMIAEKNEDPSHVWFSMNILDNPYYSAEQVSTFIKKQKKRLGLKEGEENPTFRRLVYGELCEDTHLFVYNVTAENFWEDLPEFKRSTTTVISSIDMGYSDSDAITVMKYHHIEKKIYVIKEFKINKQTYSQLAKHIKRIEGTDIPKVRILDSGGLGLKAKYEFINHHGLNMIDADKGNKMHHVEKLRDMIHTNRILFARDSLFVQDSKKIVYDEMFEKIDDKTFHSDISDAVLYGVRYVMTKFPEDFKDLEIEETLKDKETEMENFKRRMPEEDWYLLEEALGFKKKRLSHKVHNFKLTKPKMKI